MLALLKNNPLTKNLVPSRTNSLTSIQSSNGESLKNLTAGSQNILFQFKTIFPFDFFPDLISIDENKVTILSQDFFFAYHVRSIVIEDISDVSVDTGILFASITIIDSSNYRFPIIEKIKFVSKNNALLARKLLQGLILAKNKNINLTSISLAQAREQLCSLGETFYERQINPTN